jgi:hypothetical protein
VTSKSKIKHCAPEKNEFSVARQVLQLPTGICKEAKGMLAVSLIENPRKPKKKTHPIPKILHKYLPPRGRRRYRLKPSWAATRRMSRERERAWSKGGRHAQGHKSQKENQELDVQWFLVRPSEKTHETCDHDAHLDRADESSQGSGPKKINAEYFDAGKIRRRGAIPNSTLSDDEHLKELLNVRGGGGNGRGLGLKGKGTGGERSPVV